MDTRKTYTLSNGILIPMVGLGVYQSAPGPETQKAVRWALEAGYRHIDTAAVYRNEKDVGIAIKESGIARREIFITTKLGRGDHGYDSALKAFDKSLELLGLDKVDLYLIHWPGSDKRKESWKALEKIYEEGRARSIGISNYTVGHLQEVLAYCKVAPAVNQVEFSPFLFQKKLLDFCQKNGIQLEAYSPLTQGKRLKHKGLGEVAQKYQRTPAQILIRWALEHQVVVIPKSVKKERVIENFNVFDFNLKPEDLALLDKMNEDLRTCWDPSAIR